MFGLILLILVSVQYASSSKLDNQVGFVMLSKTELDSNLQRASSSTNIFNFELDPDQMVAMNLDRRKKRSPQQTGNYGISPNTRVQTVYRQLLVQRANQVNNYAKRLQENAQRLRNLANGGVGAPIGGSVGAQTGGGQSQTAGTIRPTGSGGEGTTDRGQPQGQAGAGDGKKEE